MQHTSRKPINYGSPKAKYQVPLEQGGYLEIDKPVECSWYDTFYVNLTPGMFGDLNEEAVQVIDLRPICLDSCQDYVQDPKWQWGLYLLPLAICKIFEDEQLNKSYPYTWGGYRFESPYHGGFESRVLENYKEDYSKTYVYSM